MIIIDHRRDIRKFKNAATFNDAQIRAFAKKYLPTIEAHLHRAREIKKAE